MRDSLSKQLTVPQSAYLGKARSNSASKVLGWHLGSLCRFAQNVLRVLDLICVIARPYRALLSSSP